MYCTVTDKKMSCAVENHVMLINHVTR